MHRRNLLQLGFIAGVGGWLICPTRVLASPDVTAALRQAGAVLALRHALAPGTFDPPGFRLDDCSTQRNLSDEGRAQAQRIGRWLQKNGVLPARVRTSPWCRCVDTAMLAFDKAEPWAALGSPVGYAESTGQEHLLALKDALRQLKNKAQTQQAATSTPAQLTIEVWVTHMFVLSDLVQTSVASGEGLVIAADGDGQPHVLARVVPDAT